MKKITFIVNDLTALGGATKVTYQLANKLSSNHDVRIISIFKSNEKLPYFLKQNINCDTLYQKNIKIYEIRTYIKYIKELKLKEIFELIYNIFYLLLFFNKRKKYLDRIIGKDNVIIIPEIYGLLFLKRKVLKRNKIILQLHNTFELIYHNRLNMLVINKYKKYIDRLVVLTHADKISFEKIGFNRVVQIYNSIEFPATCNNHYKNEILFLGRLDTRKGVEFIIPIYKELSKENFNVILNVFGTGPLFNYLESQIKAENLENKIILHGNTSNIEKVFENSICTILPSKIEGLPMVMLESLSYGVPVVAFHCFSGINEIITNGYNGFIVPHGHVNEFSEKISYMIKYPDKLDKMKKNALEASKKFEQSCIIKEWNDLFKMLEEN